MILNTFNPKVAHMQENEQSDLEIGTKEGFPRRSEASVRQGWLDVCGVDDDAGLSVDHRNVWVREEKENISSWTRKRKHQSKTRRGDWQGLQFGGLRVIFMQGLGD